MKSIKLQGENGTVSGRKCHTVYEERSYLGLLSGIDPRFSVSGSGWLSTSAELLTTENLNKTKIHKKKSSPQALPVVISCQSALIDSVFVWF